MIGLISLRNKPLQNLLIETTLKSLTPSLINLIDSWLDEDIGRGDLSTCALEKNIGSAYWVAKNDGIFCGGLIVEALFKRLDQSIRIHLLIQDGDKFVNGQKLIELNGPTKSLLAGERTALNIAMHLSGIATKTSLMIAELKGTNVQMTDTRKTTPGLRILEKYATRCGGGTNHRMGLDDAVMLKENHLAWSGDLEKTLKKIRKEASWPTKIIVEAENPKQAKDAIEAGADAVLLDEIEPEILKILVPSLRKLAESRDINKGPKQITIEASGVNPTELRQYANTGIDLISSSAPITRSYWIDFSMRFK